MRFRELRKVIVRRRLEKSCFYEGITFKNRFVKRQFKKIMSEWMLNLQSYKQIEIGKFKDLVNPLNEIRFPIKIESVSGKLYLYMEFLDKRKNKYYMWNSKLYDYRKLDTYIIGRRNSLLEPMVNRYFLYEITNNKTIVRQETGVMQLNQDGTNDKKVVYFSYNHEESVTEAVLELNADNIRLKIQYPSSGKAVEEKIFQFLLNMDENKSYYDVSPILQWLITVIGDKKVSVSITAEVNEEVCSDIEVVSGIVQKYTFMQVINEAEIQIHKTIFAKDLKEFMEERMF